MNTKCSACGAPLSGRKCDHCGERSRKSNRHLNHSSPNLAGNFDYSDRSGSKITALLLGILLVIISVIVFLLLPFGDSTNQDPFELLERSHQAMEELDSMQMDFDLNISFNTGFNDINLPITGVIQIDNELATMEMSGEVIELGQRLDISNYFRDGFLYITQDGHRTREMMEFDDALNEMSDLFIDTTLLSPHTTSEADLTRDGRGHRLAFTVTERASLAIMPELVLELAETNHFDNSRLTVVIYLDSSGRQTSIEYYLEVTFSEFGHTTIITTDMTMELTQFNNVNIHFPSWIDTFTPLTFILPDEDTPFLGHWDNGAGARFLWVFGEADEVEFLLDGTVVITENGMRRTETWQLTTTDIIIVDGEEFRWYINGNRLTITDSFNDDWFFDRAGTYQETEPSREDLEDHDLVGVWDNGYGARFLFVFGEADSVEFRDNGTVIITADGRSRTINWEPGRSGNFRADNQNFRYSIQGNILTITDSWDDDWTFERVD